MDRETRKAIDPPMVPFALAGMAVWALAGVLTWLLGRLDWAQICLAGVVWGGVGLLVMLRHDALRS